MKGEDPVSGIRGIGPKTAARLAGLGIRRVSDLLDHYPRDYRQYGQPLSPGDTSADESPASYAVRRGTASVSGRGRQALVTLTLKEEGEALTVRWFHMPYILSRIRSSKPCILYGRVTRKGSRRILDQPSLFEPEEYAGLTRSLQPVYPLTEGLTQAFLRKTIRQVLDQVQIREYLPAWILDRYDLCPLSYALQQIHFPDSAEACRQARRRIVFDEFFIYRLRLSFLRQMQEREGNHFRLRDDLQTQELMKLLPFSLTGAQSRVFEELAADLRGDHAMNRLIQGDVGCGKTAVAFLAMAGMALSGFQSCLMAPTAVLAHQHYETISAFLKGTGLQAVLLTGSMSVKAKREAYEKIAAHQADLIIGTHALFQERVVYDRLGLVITDEQHRFGVRQRQQLKEKNADSQPHVLVMSATPIPRTLAMILYADMDVSVIDEKPACRLPVKNCVVGHEYRKAALRLIAEQAAAGKQSYVICPLISPSEELDAQSVEEYAPALAAALGDRIRVCALHGKMDPDRKDRIMEDFCAGRIDVLVSTTVIEVGVDAPGATVMMIEDSERFGLAQLHQLRGRVGRGKDQSYCIFMHGRIEEGQRQRLAVMEETNDGFEIARKDMQTRGCGDLTGIRQSGDLPFVLADIYADAGLLTQSADAVSLLLQTDPQLQSEDHACLRDFLYNSDPGGFSLEI